MARKRPTIYDVAQVAGVTAATVSNVLNDRVVVAPATRARVEAAIETLGYRPNPVARGLAGRRTMLFALVLPAITNPFYAELSLAIESLARQEGYHLVVCNTLNDPADGREQLRRLSERWIDGVIVMPGGVDATDVNTMRQRGLSVVSCLWGEEPEQPEGPSADIAFAEGGSLAARHLIELGHRDIGIVVEAHADGSVAHGQRLEGFLSTLQGAGVSVSADRIRLADGTLEGGYRAADLLDAPTPPSAIFATNDLMALGILEAAADRAVSVPDQLALIGFDDILLGAHVRPRLTTVAMGKDALAQAATTLLFGLLSSEPGTDATSVQVSPTLVVRDSTASRGDVVGKVV